MTDNENTNDEIHSPYCKSCTSCGVTECCDPLNCAYICMVAGVNDSDCKYGVNNFADIEFAVKMYREMYNSLSEAAHIDEYRAHVDSLFDKLFEECYRKGSNEPTI